MGNTYRRAIHRGTIKNDRGEVFALCARYPKPLDLSKATFTFQGEKVTCLHCLKKMNAPDVELRLT